MTGIDDPWEEQRRNRSMRTNAHLYIRHDAYRFMPPGSPIYVGRDVVKYFWPEPKDDRPAPDDRKSAHDLGIGTDREIEAERQQLRCKLASLRLELELWKFASKWRKYSPDQPRVPAGKPDGGQWTSTGGGVGRNDPRVISDATPDNSFKPGAQLAANDRLGYPINLYEEEAFGHTIAAHVNKTSESLINQAREAFIRDPDARDSRSGSFSSIEAATKLVNSTIARNQAIVDQVASGIRIRETVISYYPSITGIEAVVPSATSTGSIRETYGVGVVIIHDRLSLKGFRILTAFPTNR